MTTPSVFPLIPLSEIPSQAQLLERSGEFRRLRGSIATAARQPDNAELWALLGRNCHALGQADEAVASFGQALRFGPTSPTSGSTWEKPCGRSVARTRQRPAARGLAPLRPDDPDP